MEKVKTAVIAALLLGVQSSFAQTVVPPLPPVPSTGLSPVLQWVFGVLSVVITVTLPIAVAFLKQRVDTADAADHSTMIDRATDHAALISYGNQIAGMNRGQAAANALDYVKSAVQPSIDKTPAATDTHLSDVIAAKVVGLNLTPAPAAVDTAVPSIAVIPTKEAKPWA